MSHVASAIGKPLYADSITDEQMRLAFARVLVEVNTESEFPKEIEIQGNDGRMIIVRVKYPWIPLKCKKCQSFGHAVYSCSKEERKVWIPKKNEQKRDMDVR